MIEVYEKFIEDNKSSFQEGLDGLLSKYKTENLLTALSEIGWRCQIIPDDSWRKGKLDPTETSKEEQIVRIKSAYFFANPDFFAFEDKCGWGYHEFAHAIISREGPNSRFLKIESPFYYPLNTEEIYCFGYQIKHLLKKGWYHNLIEEYENRGSGDLARKIDLLRQTLF